MEFFLFVGPLPTFDFLLRVSLLLRVVLDDINSNPSKIMGLSPQSVINGGGLPGKVFVVDMCC